MVLSIKELFGNAQPQNLAGELFDDIWGHGTSFIQVGVPGSVEVMLNKPFISQSLRGWEIFSNTLVVKIPPDTQLQRQILIAEERGHSLGSVQHFSSLRTNLGGIVTYLFDSNGRLVPDLWAKEDTSIWVCCVELRNGTFRDTTSYPYSHVGLWFQEGECKLSNWQLQLWTTRMRYFNA
jgi:hypothetical protein